MDSALRVGVIVGVGDRVMVAVGGSGVGVKVGVQVGGSVGRESDVGVERTAVPVRASATAVAKASGESMVRETTVTTGNVAVGVPPHADNKTAVTIRTAVEQLRRLMGNHRFRVLHLRPGGAPSR